MKLDRRQLRKIILNEMFGFGSSNPSVDIVFDNSESDRYDTYLNKSEDGKKYILIATEENPPAIRVFKDGDEIQDSVKFKKGLIPAQGTKAALKLLKDKSIDLNDVEKVYVHQV
jgi:hypothetical protein